jgi:hypothetical protein
MQIEFEEAEHIYRIDGLQVPSVTQCLGLLDLYDGLNKNVLAAAREFGIHGHKAMALAVRNQLNWSTLDGALVPYVTKGIEFLAEVEKHSTITASELIVGDPKLKVAGTIDLLTENERYTDLYEFKFTYAPPPMVGLQTAAYAHLLRQTRPSLCKKPLRRWCVVLWESGPRTLQLVSPADFQYFLSFLNVTHWKLRHGF